jgi:hypothetical protein
MAGYIPRRPSSHLTRQGGAHFLSFDNGALVLRFLPLSGNAAPNYPEFVLPWGTNWGIKL